MDDLISRQAAIDAIFGRSHEIIKMRISNLQSAESEQRWIPCSERLPEKWGDYLVTIKWKGVESGNVYTEIHTAVYDERAKEWDYTDVIAWMPLPDAYEEDK